MFNGFYCDQISDKGPGYNYDDDSDGEEYAGMEKHNFQDEGKLHDIAENQAEESDNEVQTSTKAKATDPTLTDENGEDQSAEDVNLQYKLNEMHGSPEDQMKFEEFGKVLPKDYFGVEAYEEAHKDEE